MICSLGRPLIAAQLSCRSLAYIACATSRCLWSFQPPIILFKNTSTTFHISCSFFNNRPLSQQLPPTVISLIMPASSAPSTIADTVVGTAENLWTSLFGEAETPSAEVSDTRSSIHYADRGIGASPHRESWIPTCILLAMADNV